MCLFPAALYFVISTFKCWNVVANSPIVQSLLCTVVMFFKYVLKTVSRKSESELCSIIF